MKIFKTLLTLFILFACFGCASRDKKTPEINADNPTALNQVPKYKYSDEFFNNNFTNDDKGNCYFLGGQYFYKTNQNNNITKIFHRLINNKYYVYSAKYYNEKIYLLVIKVNHKIEGGSLGIATIDLQGNNFQYLNDLEYGEKYLPITIVDFKISNNNLYILDLQSPTPCTYTYSLDSNSIIDYQPTSIDRERFKFYKEYFPSYPYEEIQHIKDNNFYLITESKNKEKTFTKYNPIDKSTESYNLNEYYDFSDNKILLRIDLIGENWFLLSNKGIFKFDYNFKNKHQLLDGSIFNQSYTITPKNQMLVFEFVDNN